MREMSAKKCQDSFSYLLVHVCKAHRGALADALAEVSLYPGQEMILIQLWEEDGLNQSQLIGDCRVEAPTLTKALHRMEKAGLVERRRDSQDARVSRVYLTKRGRSLQESVSRCWAEVETRMLSELTVEEKILLRRLLMHIRDSLG